MPLRLPNLGSTHLMLLFSSSTGSNALRQHLKDDVRIHGIINEGGQAPNVVPDLASARFYFRAKDRKYLNEMFQKILKIAEGAALMTGAKMEWRKLRTLQRQSCTEQKTRRPL